MIKQFFRFFIGFSILIFVQYLCYWLVKITKIPIPTPILGIILLCFLLNFKIIKKEWVKDICELMLKYMPLLFVPISVGIIVYFGVIESNFIPIIVNVIVTTTVTLIVTAFFVENVIKYIRLSKMRKNTND